MMKYTYFFVLFFSVIVPFVFSFYPKLKFNKHFSAFFTANFLVASVFILWDMYFTSIGIWGFSPKYTTGIKIANLPIEEVLFFICIPFCCLFTIHCFRIFFDLKWKEKVEQIFVLIFALMLMFFGIIFIEKAYTSSTFISTAILLILLKYYYKVNWLGIFFSIYPVLLIPFFIVNGILTGTGLESPVVWYNNDENLGIRMGTIPFEDIFYGLELLLLNYFFYDRFFYVFQKIKKQKGNL